VGLHTHQTSNLIRVCLWFAAAGSSRTLGKPVPRILEAGAVKLVGASLTRCSTPTRFRIIRAELSDSYLTRRPADRAASHGCFLRLRQGAQVTRDHRRVNGGQFVQPEHGRGRQICRPELGSSGVHISGIGPTGPAGTSTGRSFIPAVSPNGKLASQISPGCIYGLAVRQSVNVLPHAAQLVTPSLRHAPGPKGARLIFVRPDDNQLDRPGREVAGRFCAGLRRFRPLCRWLAYGRTSWPLLVPAARQASR